VGWEYEHPFWQSGDRVRKVDEVGITKTKDNVPYSGRKLKLSSATSS